MAESEPILVARDDAIVTVTLNQAIDQTLVLPRFVAGDTIRVKASRFDPGGKGIKGIEATTGAKVEIEEDGTVFVSCVDADMAEKARNMVEAAAAEVKVGRIYDGRVTSVKDFGAFVEILPGQDGLCHISELSDGYVQSVSDVCKVGDEFKVKVILVDDQGRVKLSKRAADAELAEQKV